MAWRWTVARSARAGAADESVVVWRWTVARSVRGGAVGESVVVWRWTVARSVRGGAVGESVVVWRWTVARLIGADVAGEPAAGLVLAPPRVSAEEAPTEAASTASAPRSSLGAADALGRPSRVDVCGDAALVSPLALASTPDSVRASRALDARVADAASSGPPAPEAAARGGASASVRDSCTGAAASPAGRVGAGACEPRDVTPGRAGAARPASVRATAAVPAEPRPVVTDPPEAARSAAPEPRPVTPGAAGTPGPALAGAPGAAGSAAPEEPGPAVGAAESVPAAVDAPGVPVEADSAAARASPRCRAGRSARSVAAVRASCIGAAVSAAAAGVLAADARVCSGCSRPSRLSTTRRKRPRGAGGDVTAGSATAVGAR